MAALVERNWLDSWPERRQEVRDQIDTEETNERMNGMSDDEVKELNI